MSSVNSKYTNSLSGQSGVASLSTILVIVLLILVIALSVTALAINESSNSLSQSNTITAEDYADAGARDALQKIADNKAYYTSSPYTISFVTNGCLSASSTPGCATVSVSSASGTQANPVVVTSLGAVSSNKIEVQVNVIFDSSGYGQIATTTWQEISL